MEGGYNSEDEYSHIGVQLTEEEWQEKDRRFERLIKKKKGMLMTCMPLFLEAEIINQTIISSYVKDFLV